MVLSFFCRFSFGFFLVGALDSQFLHLLVRADFIFGELPVLAEYDIEAHSEDAKSDDDKAEKKNFHRLENEFSADRFVVIYFVDNACEHACHRNDLDLAGVLAFCWSERDRVGDEHFAELGLRDVVKRFS